jgi:hypothetical protein
MPTYQDEFALVGKISCTHTYSAKSALMSASKINIPTTPTDRDPTVTFDKNAQRHFFPMAWINKRPATSITAQVTP